MNWDIWWLKPCWYKKNRSPQVQGSCATEVEITFETWNSFMICRESVKPKWGSIWYIYIYILIYTMILLYDLYYELFKKKKRKNVKTHNVGCSTVDGVMKYCGISYTDSSYLNVWSINRTVVLIGVSHTGSNYKSMINRIRRYKKHYVRAILKSWWNPRDSAPGEWLVTLWGRPEVPLPRLSRLWRCLCVQDLRHRDRCTGKTFTVDKHSKQDKQQKLFHVSTVLLHQTLGDVGVFLQGTWIKLPWLTLLSCVLWRECHKRSPRVQLHFTCSTRMIYIYNANKPTYIVFSSNLLK